MTNRLFARIALLPLWIVTFSGVAPSHAALLIKLQPASVVAHPEDTVRFKVRVIDGSSIQWYRNGAVIDSAIDSTLIVPAVSASDDGARFACVATSGGISENSKDATLNVVPHTRQLVTLTGNLAGADGNMVGSSGRTIVDVRVDLFSAVSGGESFYSERFWAEDGRGVGVENGIFTLRLGEGKLDSSSGELHVVVATNRNLFVQFTVGSGESKEVLQPRLPFTAMPYAISGNSSVLKGVVDPNTVGLVAPIGTFYVNTKANTTWIRTARTWVTAN